MLERNRETGDRMPLPTALHGSVDVTLRDGTLRLPDRFTIPFAGGLVITSWLDGCLALWPRSSWEDLSARLMALPIADSAARAFARLLFASAIELAEGLRSVRLPERHRRTADLGEDAVLVGAGDHVEVWSRQRWTEQATRRLDDFSSALAF
jgi:MraZ protein